MAVSFARAAGLYPRRRSIAASRAWRSPLRRREADGHRHGQPVRVLAGDVAAIDEIDRKGLDRPQAQTRLKARPGHAGDVGGAGLAEYLAGQRPDFRYAPIDADAMAQIMAVDV